MKSAYFLLFLIYSKHIFVFKMKLDFIVKPGKDIKSAKQVYEVLIVDKLMDFNLNITVKGKFLLARTTATGNKFNGTVTFNEVMKVPNVGNFTFEFYTFITCQKIGCEVAGDYLQLGIKYIDEADYQIIYKFQWNFLSIDNLRTFICCLNDEIINI